MFKQNKLRTALLSAIAASAASNAVSAKQIEEVVVTATKRAQSMQDIPVSVSAIQEQDLKNLRIGDFQDYLKYLPNVVSQGTGPGQNELYIRGAATSQTILTLSSVQGLKPLVALYLDDMPVSMQGRNLDIYATDIKRIEVLPGPQGTLFGASSEAGTVRLITNKPDPSLFEAGFDATIKGTKGGDMSHKVEAHVNIPLSDDLALRVAAYNDHQGGWIDNILNDPSNGGWNGSTIVIDRISGHPLPSPSTMTIPVPRNDQLVQKNFNTATYSGGRFGASYTINDDWNVLVQHTQQSLNTEGVWAYDPNLKGKSSVNRFAPDNNRDDFGLTTWTVKGRLGMLDLVYTGGYLDRDIHSSVDYTFYTNGGLFSAFYVCYPGNGTYDQCFDPQKFYKEHSTNTRMTHEFRINTPEQNRWRLTAGVFHDDTELASVGKFKIASTDSPYFSNLARVLAAPPGTAGTNTNGGPFGPEISFVNDVTRTTRQIALFGEFEYDILRNVTATFGARWYDIEDIYKGATTTVNVTARLKAFGNPSLAAFNQANAVGAGISDPAATLAAINSGQLKVGSLDKNGVLHASDVIFKGSLDWRPTDNIMLFTTYSQGFRAPVTNRVGGSLANVQTGAFTGFRVPVYSKTDHLDNYELGLKSELFDKSLRFNITGYYSKIRNLQTSRFDPTNISFLWFADNVGDARIYGADGDFVWLAGSNLTIGGAFSVLDSKITKLNPQLVGIAPPVGSELPYSANFSGNLHARYDFDFPDFGGVSGLKGFVSGGVTYKGDSLTGLKMDAYVVEDTMKRVYNVAGSGLKIKREAANYAGAPAGTTLLNQTGVPGGRYIQPGYALLNMTFGVSKDNWSGEFFIDNLTDTNADVYIDTQQFTPHVVTNRPRTFGFRVSYNYQ
jgi:iron complex outermembrane receptor protein